MRRSNAVDHKGRPAARCNTPTRLTTAPTLANIRPLGTPPPNTSASITSTVGSSNKCRARDDDGASAFTLTRMFPAATNGATDGMTDVAVSAAHHQR